eukprot:COSAG02_NODE_4220_length_5616_cov_13.985862_3_plen_112_part_00
MSYADGVVCIKVLRPAMTVVARRRDGLYARLPRINVTSTAVALSVSSTHIAELELHELHRHTGASILVASVPGTTASNIALDICGVVDRVKTRHIECVYYGSQSRYELFEY